MQCKNLGCNEIQFEQKEMRLWWNEIQSDGMTAHSMGLNDPNAEHHAVHANKRRWYVSNPERLGS